MEEELISLIVPVYNVENYVSRCINSLLQQTYKNLEIILVDDGSTDKSGVICDEFRQKDNRIKVFHKENGGLSDARNYGLKYFNGNYVAFVDSDDWISKYCIENLYLAIIKNSSDMASSWFVNVYDANYIQTEPTNLLLSYICLTKEQYLEKLLYQDFVETSAWGKLYKKSIIKDLRYPVGMLYEDMPVTYEAIKRSNKIALIENVDWYYFQRKNSIQNMSFNPRKMDGITNCKQLMENVRYEFPHLINAAECRYFSLTCNIFFQIPEDKKYFDLKNYLWNEILKYRKSVIFNQKARKKARLGALLSLFGNHFFSYAYHLTQERGKK